MAIKITKNINRLTARAFYNAVKYSEDDTYYTALSYYNDSDYEAHSGRFDSESAFFGGTEDSDLYDLADFNHFYKNTTTLHKVFKGGITRVVPRIDWIERTIYEGWSPNSTEHYVLVNEVVQGVSKLNVYKCLYSPGTPSIDPPQGGLPLPFNTSDNYWWLYLYTISNSEALRFLTANWMPVPEAVTSSEIATLQPGTNRYYQYIQQVSAVKGAIYGVAIDSDAALAAYPALVNGVPVPVNAINTDPFLEDSDRFTANIVWDSENNKVIMNLVTTGSGYETDIKYQDDSEREINWLTAYPAPSLGHGSNAPLELGADYLMVSTRTVPLNELLYFTETTFKTVGLVLNPVDKTTRTTARNDYYFGCRSLDTTITNDYTIGDIIKPRFNDDGRRLRVVGKNGATIYYTDITPLETGLTGVFNANELISDTTGTKNFKVLTNKDRQATFTYEDLILLEVLPEPVRREDDQIESINLIFRF